VRGADGGERRGEHHEQWKGESNAEVSAPIRHTVSDTATKWSDQVTFIAYGVRTPANKSYDISPHASREFLAVKLPEFYVMVTARTTWPRWTSRRAGAAPTRRSPAGHVRVGTSTSSRLEVLTCPVRSYLAASGRGCIGDTVTLPVAWNSNGVKRENVTAGSLVSALCWSSWTPPRGVWATQPTSLRRTDHGSPSRTTTSRAKFPAAPLGGCATSKTPTATACRPLRTRLDARHGSSPTSTAMVGWPVTRRCEAVPARSVEDGTRADGEN